MQSAYTTRGERDAHVRAYYDQPANDFAAYSSSRYDGGTSVAVAVAYERTLDGCEEDFGDVNEGGYYARVLFEHAPFIVCLRTDEFGFVSEVTNSEYEAAHAQWIEEGEMDEEDAMMSDETCDECGAHLDGEHAPGCEKWDTF